MNTIKEVVGVKPYGRYSHEEIYYYAEYVVAEAMGKLDEFLARKDAEAQAKWDAKVAENIRRDAEAKLRKAEEEVAKADGSYYIKSGFIPNAEYRRLMSIHHPDKGGSTEFAQKLNNLRRVA